MVLQQLRGHAFLPSFLDVAHDGPDFVFHALQADVAVQLPENLFLCLGNEGFVVINVNGFYCVAATQFGTDTQIVGHFLGKSTIDVGQLFLPHIP